MREIPNRCGWRAGWLLTLVLICAAAEVAQDRLGIVVDDRDGRPLAGARLSVQDCRAGSVKDPLETGADGLLQFAAPSGQGCWYRISRDGSVPMILHLRENDNEPFRAGLASLGWIEGTVTDSAGDPVGGAAVTALRWDDRTAAASTTRAAEPGSGTTTNAKGRFRLYNLMPGEYAVGVIGTAATGPGFTLYPDNRRPKKIAVQPGGGYQNIHAQLTTEVATYKVAGKVAVPNQSALPASVFLTFPGQPQIVLASTQAAPDGGFRFEGLPAGRYDLYAVAPSTGRGSFNSEMARQQKLYARRRVEAGAVDEQEVVVALEPAKTISMSLRCQAGPGCKRCPSTAVVTVSSLVPWGLPGGERAVELQSSVARELPGVPPGPLRLSIGGLGASCFAVNERLEVPDDAAAREPVIVSIGPAAELEVAVSRADGSTAERIEVYVLAEEVTSEDSAVRVSIGAADTAHVFAGLRPGKYRVMARPALAEPDGGWSRDTAAWAEVEVGSGSNRTAIPLAKSTRK